MLPASSSQSPSQLQLDRNGYSLRDKFVVTDDRESLEFTDEDPSTDDDSVTEASGDEDDQPDPREERQRRRGIVQDAIARMKAKATEAGTAIFPYSVSLDELTTQRATPIRVKRRIVNRTVLVDVMLNTWLNGNLERLDVDIVSEFLRLLKLHALDRAKSIYYPCPPLSCGHFGAVHLWEPRKISFQQGYGFSPTSAAVLLALA